MSDEFEDRQNEGVYPENELGELPPEAKPGEQDAYKKRPDPSVKGGAGVLPGSIPQYIPPDIAAEEMARLRGYGKGGAEIGGVSSVYDTLPIHARRFTFVDTPCFDAGTFKLSTTYTIPSGYTAVWRGFRYCPTGLMDFRVGVKTGCSDSATEILNVSLFYNGNAVPDFANMQMDQACTQGFPVYVLGESGGEFTLEITTSNNLWYSFASYDSLDDIHFRTELFGHLLLSRGLNLPFEISSQNIIGGQ